MQRTRRTLMLAAAALVAPLAFAVVVSWQLIATIDRIDRIAEGMTREQVENLMGSSGQRYPTWLEISPDDPRQPAACCCWRDGEQHARVHFDDQWVVMAVQRWDTHPPLEPPPTAWQRFISWLRQRLPF